MSGFQAAAVSGSVMILVIALLRLTAGKRLPRALFPALWCAAAFRLLLPVRLPSALSVWNLTAGESRAARTAAQISEHLTPFPSLTVAPAAQEAAARLSLPGLIWAAGALLLGAYFLVGWLRFTRRFAGAAPVGNETVDSCVEAFGFRRPPVIRCTTDSRAPLTYGVRRPVVLLPADLLADREALRMILTHELAHIRRRDCLRKLLFTLCLCVYWWNPVCWGMVLLANRDLELACDALTLRYLGRDRRKTYALTLLELAARQAQPHPLCSGFGKPAAEERIQAIMKAKKIPVYLTILVAGRASHVGRLPAPDARGGAGMTPIVLAVHFPAKQLSKLRMAAMRLGAKVRVVEKWEYLNAVGALTGDLSSFETFYDGEDFSGQLLVFAHFTDERLQLFLQAMKQSKLPPVALKAVLTDENKGWTILELHEELLKEHQALHS